MTVRHLAFAATLVCLVSAGPRRKLVLSACDLPGMDEPARCGVYSVFENRSTREGRMLPLRIVVLPSRSARVRLEPVFYFAGGPGETNTDFAKELQGSSLR